MGGKHDISQSAIYQQATQELDALEERTRPLPPGEAVARARTLLLESTDDDKADDYPTDALGSLATVAECI
ncbi:hypothetical protein, partial [Halothiobacillus sp.]|uniref:hypothetical protein n=1 Tax=Halothiobacillus sp. TaxID=1891311 RepID=UPI002635CA26